MHSIDSVLNGYYTGKDSMFIRYHTSDTEYPWKEFSLTSGGLRVDEFSQDGSSIHDLLVISKSNQQINSNDHVPTSSLVYSMNQTLTSLEDSIYFTTVESWVVLIFKKFNRIIGFRNASTTIDKSVSGHLPGIYLPYSNTQIQWETAVMSASQVGQPSSKLKYNVLINDSSRSKYAIDAYLDFIQNGSDTCVYHVIAEGYILSLV